MTRTQLRDLFQRHQSGERLDQALHALTTTGRARHTKILTAGRPPELWTATAPAA
jgi:hypothetical protein